MSNLCWGPRHMEIQIQIDDDDEFYNNDDDHEDDEQ